MTRDERAELDAFIKRGVRITRLLYLQAGLGILSIAIVVADALAR
jgi:hypothetical protein